MTYPKPLSEKTINKMYAEANLEGEKKEFLHRFFKAAANLYGSIMLQDIWYVYREYSKYADTPTLHKKDFIAFSSIVRRAEVSYFVFEVNEIYCDDQPKDNERFIVTKQMVGNGYGKFHALWNLNDMQQEKPLYIPKDFLEYVELPVSRAQKEMLDFLSNLKVTANEYTNDFGKVYPCEHQGQRLGEFDFLDSDERFEVKYMGGEIEGGPKGNAKKVAEYLEERKGPESDKLMRDFMWRTYSGWADPQMSMKFLFKELNEVGVQLTEKQLRKLIELINEVHNNTHVWVNRGWTPMELTQQYIRNHAGPQAISFGPGIERAISEGKMNREELIKMFEAKGFKVVKQESRFENSISVGIEAKNEAKNEAKIT